MAAPTNFIKTKNAADASFPSLRPDSTAARFSDTAPDAGISAYWRKNTSFVEAAELANLLRALRKVAGHLGENAGRVEYAGMSAANGAAILIEPELVMGKYPVPADRVDFVVGIVVHAALHNIEWSDHVWKILEPSMAEMAALDRVVFQKMVRTGEDIYVDQKADQSVFGSYTRVARDRSLSAWESRSNCCRPSVDELFHLWLICSFIDAADRPAAAGYKPVLGELYALSDALRGVTMHPESVTKRCEQRAADYLLTWHKIRDRIMNWPVIDRRLYWFGSDLSHPVSAAGQSKKTPGKQKTPALLNEIETRLAADSADITPIIRSVVGYDDESVVPMSRWDFNMPSRPVIDHRMVSRLKSIFIQYAHRNIVVSRGLTSGRVDSRRLYRASVTGKCFAAIDRIPCPDWHIGLLIDASGSMRGRKWRLVENAVATIHRALGNFGNHLNAWAYFEVNGICMISRLIINKRLVSVPPSGQTASGQAIIAAAGMMAGNRSRRLLIHVTDGESNFGCDVSYGIAFCRQENIHLFTLGCGCRNSSLMESQYGNTVQLIEYFEQLPRAIELLFKQEFLYGAPRASHMKSHRFSG